MKPLKVLLSLFILVVFALFIAPVSQAITAVSQSTVKFDLWDWIIKNWSVIFLFISEILAFLPSKWTGVIKTILTIIDKIIKIIIPSTNKSLKISKK